MAKAHLKRQLKYQSWELDRLQQRKIKKFGVAAIEEAMARLCSVCTFPEKAKLGACKHLPICLDGKDCPYFMTVNGNEGGEEG
jgi:hypothetical protein